MDAWFDKGWNVGIFYWDQFSDEPHACDAERKIYSNHMHLRWLSNLPEEGPDYLAELIFKNYSGPAQSLADVCADNIAGVMHDYTGPEVRLVGHSMGTQLAIECARVLHERKAKAAPTRLVLSEAAFIFQPRMFADGCDDSEMFEGTNFGEYALKKFGQSMAALRARGVFTEYIQTLEGKMRLLVDGEVSKNVEKQSVSVKYRPDWCSTTPTHGLAQVFPWICAHDAAHVLYMLSMANTGPCIAPTAACSVEDIAKLLGAAEPVVGARDREWVQVAGTETVDTSDDIFQVQYKTGTNEAMVQRYTDQNESVQRIALRGGSDSVPERHHMLDLFIRTPIGLALLALLACAVVMPLLLARPPCFLAACCGGKSYSELKCKDIAPEQLEQLGHEVGHEDSLDSLETES